MTWVDELLSRLENAKDGILEVEVGGQKIVAEIGEDVLLFFKQNKAMLLRLGKDTFRSFLLLIHEKRDEEAFNLLLSKMNAEDIIARMEFNANQLGEYNDNRDKFIAAVKKFVVSALLPTIAKALFGLLF
jgi:hypothetical protein